MTNPMTTPATPTPEEQQTARKIAERAAEYYFDLTAAANIIASALAAARATDQQRIKELSEALQEMVDVFDPDGNYDGRCACHWCVAAGMARMAMKGAADVQP